MLLDLNNIILAVVFAVNTALAAYFFAKDRKNATNLSFSAVLLSLALWSISFVFWAVSVNPSWIQFWIHINWLAFAVLPALFLYFSVVFPKPDFMRLRPGLISAFLPALIFGIVSFTDLISKGISPPYVEPEHGQWYILYAAYVIAYLGYSLFIILSKYRRLDGKEKLQIQYFLLGLSIAAFIGILTNIFLVSRGMIAVGPIMVNAIGPISTLVMAGLISYSIIRDKLPGMDELLSRAVVFTAAAAVITGSLNFIAYGDLQSLIPFNVIITDAALGLYILFQNRKSEINRAFCALSICFAFWIYAILNFAGSMTLVSAEFWSKLLFIGPALIPPIFFYFTNVFPRKDKDISASDSVLLVLLPLAAIAMLPADFTVKEVVAGESGFSMAYGMGFSLFLSYFIIHICYSISRMGGKYFSSAGIEKMQMRYLIFGAALSAFFAGVTGIALPWFNEYRFIVYSPLFTLIFLVTTAYAIGVPRLLSIEYMMQKGFIYLVTTAIFTAFYIAAGLVSGQLPADILGYKPLIAFMFFALIASIIYQPVYEYIMELSDRLLYGGRYNYQKTLLGLSQGITSVIKLGELINLIISTFLDNIKVEEISVLLFDEKRKRFRSAPCDLNTGGKYKRIEFDAAGPIAAYLSANREILVRDEIESEIDKHSSVLSEKGLINSYKALRDELVKLEMAVWVPVISKRELIAIICLGYKMSGDMYTDEDAGLLKTLANQIAVAFENSKMYTTIARQYEELKLTKDKLSEADKLASLGTMAAGMAHEIKNPLSSMKVFTQLLHERYGDAEFRKKFEEVIPKEINRIDRIVEGLLSFAMSPELKLSTVDVHEILEEILSDMKDDFQRSGITVIKKFNPIPMVLAEKEQLRRAFSNIIVNANEAMTNGGKLEIQTSADEPSNTVQVKMIDSGHGISTEHLKHIFDPFFTTRHYGTGLGLTITQSIINGLKGRINIHSEEGKGTTATVTLPASKPVI
jgi:signal transduction histidine kinase